MIVCLSYGSVRFGCDKNKVIEFIKERFAGLVDGIELCFILKEELDSFKLSKNDLDFVNSLKFNTLHAPVIGLDYGKNKETKTVLEKIQAINKKIKLKQVVFHPDHVSDFHTLAESGLNVCIENLPDGEKRKGWQFPKEFQKFFNKWPQFGFCFDVNHAMANNINPSEFISVLGEKMKYIHLNATAKPGNADHDLLVEASEETLEKIKPVFKLQKPLVIEVDIEKEKIPLIKKEINLVRTFTKK